MTEHDLLKSVSAVTGLAMNRIVKQRNKRPTLRTECDARALAILAGRSLWPERPVTHLGEFLGLGRSGACASLRRGNLRFKDDKEFRVLARNLLREIEAKKAQDNKTQEIR